MKTVLLRNNVVIEVIPNHTFPIAEWYGPDFAARCMEAPDEVDQHWVYDPETQTFSSPPPKPEPAPTDTEILNTLLGVD